MNDQQQISDSQAFKLIESIALINYLSNKGAIFLSESTLKELENLRMQIMVGD